ncbi:MAG: metallophosphoesterase [Chloroflexota bacterium]
MNHDTMLRMTGARPSRICQHPIWLIIVIAAPIFTAAMLVWSLNFHNTDGFFRVIRPVQPALAFMILVSLAPAILTGVNARLKSNLSLRSRLSLLTAILAVFGVMMPVAGFSYIGGYSLIEAGNKPVQLLVLDRTGNNGVPGIAVTFWTKQSTQNTLKWDAGTSSGRLTENTPSRSHYFVLRDLPQDTEVNYQVNQGETRRFRTPPKPGQQFRFTVTSDAHFGASDARPDLTAKMLRQIASPQNRFSVFIFTGDLVEHGYNDSHWQEALSTITSGTSFIPSLFAAGNHDTIMGGLRRFQEYLTPANRTDSLWRRVDVSGVHFFLLDREWNDDSIPPERKTWLERELRSIPPSDWTVVISHAYYYASGGVYGWYPWYDDETAIRELVPLFEKYDVDLVFSGHNHQLELLQKNKITYVICGAFGGIPDPPATYTSPASVWYAGGQYGFVEATLGDRAELIFRDADSRALKTFIIER